MKIVALVSRSTSRATHTVDGTEVIQVERKIRKNGKATGLTETVNVTVPITEYAYNEGTVRYNEGDTFNVVSKTATRYQFRNTNTGKIESAPVEDFKVICEGKGCNDTCHLS